MIHGSIFLSVQIVKDVYLNFKWCLVSVFKHCLFVSGVYADKIGIEAAEMLLRNIRHNGCVDEFLQDQVRETTRTLYLWPHCDLLQNVHTLTADFFLLSSSSSWHWQREGLGFEPVLSRCTHKQPFTLQSSWHRWDIRVQCCQHEWYERVLILECLNMDMLLCPFQAKFTITKCEDELSSNVTYIIECDGSGATNPHL